MFSGRLGFRAGQFLPCWDLEAVYVDTSTDLPSFGTVQVGMPTWHRLVFVPLDQATAGPGCLKVVYDKISPGPVRAARAGREPAADHVVVAAMCTGAHGWAAMWLPLRP